MFNTTFIFDRCQVNFAVVAYVKSICDLKDLTDEFDRLVQGRRNSSALTMGLGFSCINPPIWQI